LAAGPLTVSNFSYEPQRFSASSKAAVKPNSENVSLVVVPFDDLPVMIADAPRFIAVMMLLSASGEGAQAV
jgi:hypothetical protein